MIDNNNKYFYSNRYRNRLANTAIIRYIGINIFTIMTPIPHRRFILHYVDSTRKYKIYRDIYIYTNINIFTSDDTTCWILHHVDQSYFQIPYRYKNTTIIYNSKGNNFSRSINCYIQFSNDQYNKYKISQLISNLQILMIQNIP